MALGKKESRRIPVIVTAGRVSEQKNYPLLQKAIAKACETKDLRLIALGTGKAKKMKEIESLCASLIVSDNVDFIGFSSNPYPYIKQANLFALASNWEGFGIVLLEALSCGTTIVSTDCPTGPHDILEGEKFGYLSPTEDVDGFSASISNALKSPIPTQDLIKRSEEYNLKTTMSYYDWAINKVLGEVSTATQVMSLQANQKLSETMATD